MRKSRILILGLISGIVAIFSWGIIRDILKAKDFNDITPKEFVNKVKVDDTDYSGLFNKTFSKNLRLEESYPSKPNSSVLVYKYKSDYYVIVHKLKAAEKFESLNEIIQLEKKPEDFSMNGAYQGFSTYFDFHYSFETEKPLRKILLGYDNKCMAYNQISRNLVTKSFTTKRLGIRYDSGSFESVIFKRKINKKEFLEIEVSVLKKLNNIYLIIFLPKKDGFLLDKELFKEALNKQFF